MSRPINDDVFRAIAHPARRRVIELLRVADHTPTELLEQFSMSKQTLSMHLHVLRETGIVVQRRVKLNRVYSLRRRTLRPIGIWFEKVK